MRKTPLKRKTPLRGNPKKVQEWKDRHRGPLPVRTKKRSSQERQYSSDRVAFLRSYPVCPVTGDPATEIHHSARRVGKWLNLKRYWIGVSRQAHEWIEANGDEAEKIGLMVRYSPSHTYDQHMNFLRANGINPDVPVFYSQVRYCEKQLAEIRERIKRSK